ncbi:MAG: helix-turn-helix domain-containing protein [Dehalococcoidia bacterium]|nr:helix-turn-helix domain-containing protein [Dehalococcoidia bacterium]
MTSWRPAEVFPPGDYIKEEMNARGWAQQDLADTLGKTVAAVNELISGKRAVTAETAQLLEQAFEGIDAATWLRLEATWQAYRLPPAKDERVALRARLREKVPLREMLRRGWIEPGDEQSLERSVAGFLEIDSLDDEPAWAKTYAARKSTSYDSASAGELAWVARARQLARAVQAQPFDPKAKGRLLADIRALARNPEDARNLPRLLADYGIRLVIVEKLSRTRVDGACFWLDPKSPVIALSLRYDRMDYFWFTLLHELGHIFEDHSGDCHIESDLVGAAQIEEKPEREVAADHFAASALVDQAKLNDFIVRNGPIYNVMNIRGFARLQDIHPGIVVGQLQHMGEIDWSQHRAFLERIRDVVTRSTLTDGHGVRLSALT